MEIVREDDQVSSDRIVVYTCVTKAYDRLCPIAAQSENVKFICFTDNNSLVSTGWQAMPLQSPARLKSEHDINRFHKFFPHRLFPDARYSVYLDGNVEFLGGYAKLVEDFVATGGVLGAFVHQNRRSLIDEANACRSGDKFDRMDLIRIKEQLRTYRDAGYDLDRLISANYFIVRDHENPQLSTAMSLCWSHLFEFTKRDQISLNFALWKEGVPFVFLNDVEGVNAEDLVVHPHSNAFFREKLPHFVKRKLRSSLANLLGEKA